MPSQSQNEGSDAADESNLDLNKYKEMIRLSNSEGRDSLHRSSHDDFVSVTGGTSASGRSPLATTKAKPGILKSPDRPDDWLGSPSKRKSYKVKNHLPNVAGAGGGHEFPVASPPMGNNDSSMSPSLLPDPERYKAMMRDSIVQQEEPNRSQEFIGGSSSGHNTIPRNSWHGSSHSSNSNSKHKWGAPESPEQFRPDDWLGSPSSAKRKSYTVKSVAAAVASIPNLEDDTTTTTSDADNKNASTTVSDHNHPTGSTTATTATASTAAAAAAAASLSPKPRSRTIPGESQSLAIGVAAPKVSPKVPVGLPNTATATAATATATARPIGRAVKSQSLGLGQRSPFGISPIRNQERVDRNKFVNAFSAFEQQCTTLPPSAFASASSPVASKTKHNFKVSNSNNKEEAKGKSDLLSSSRHSNINNPPRPPRDWRPLNQAILQLRKVAIQKDNHPKTTPNEPCDEQQQAWEILQIIKHLKHNRVVVDDLQGAETFLHIVQSLRREMIMVSDIAKKDLDDIQGSLQEALEGIAARMDYQEPHRLEIEICARILNQVSASNTRSTGMLEDVIGRLKCVPVDELKTVTQRLEEISWKMGEREIEELANVIRNSEPVDLIDDDETPMEWDDLTRVLCSLNHLVDDLSSAASPFFREMGESQASLAMQEYSPRGRDTIISPMARAKRNFKVSDEAKRKSMAIMDLSTHSEMSAPPDDELQTVLASLKKVVITPKKEEDADKSSQQASELLQMVQHLRKVGGGTDAEKEFFDLFEDLNHQGVFSSNLGPNRINQIREAIQCLEDHLRRKSANDNYNNPETKQELLQIIKLLRKLTPTCAGAVDMIQQAINGLRKIIPNAKDHPTTAAVMDNVIDRLQQVIQSMRDGQEAELAEAIRDLRGNEESKKGNSNSKNMDELEHVLAGLKAKRSATKKVEEETARILATRAKDRFKPEDADYLVYALCKLKKTKLTKKEAAAVAGFIRRLRPVQTPEDEKVSDEALEKIRPQFDKNKKSTLAVIIRVLKGLRRLNLNDPERFELAEIVRSLGKGNDKYRDEITDAIAKLRRVRMTRPEAKEAAGIMFNLRKAKKTGFDINTSREMVNLRKVMADEKADVVAETFHELGKVDLSEKEIDEFAGIVAELEVQPLEPTEHQLFTVEYEVGEPFLVLNIPYGKDYANKLKNLGISDHIKKKTTYKTSEVRFWIELDPDDNLSDELLNDADSAFEEESDGEGVSSPSSGTEKRLTIKMKPRKPSITSASPKRTSASPKTSSKSATSKKLIPSVAVKKIEEPSLVVDEEREKKIRFNSKPHWRFKKHNSTVVSSKRWRFEEGFDADEVIWSPLSRDQYDRRKTVGASILATMGDFASLDDMLLDEFEKDGEGQKK